MMARSALVLVVLVLTLAVGHNVNVYAGTSYGATWGNEGGCEVGMYTSCWVGREG